MDNQQEIFPIVDVFNSKGDIYLQRRPEWKDIQLGKWDTAVGGHMDYGETPEEALRREVREELGILPLTTRQITADNATEQLRRLYQTAFPEDEQIPWPDLMRLISEMDLDFTAYSEGDAFIGFTIVYPRPAFNWYWYFAVREELRGKGYGQQILTLLIEKYKGQSCVLDMESPYQEPCPNPAQRKRRHGFYLRNGFHDTNVFRKFDDIEMTIMMMGPGTFTLQDWDDIIGELRKHWTWD